MNILLLYYTGTFNTRYLSERIAHRLEKDGDNVTLYQINQLKTERLDYTPYDMVGLGYPIYGFSAPRPFVHFIRAQHFPKGLKMFIYKNSGEVYHDNDASSMYVLRKLRRCRVSIKNEYHFGMPYNIHFRYDTAFVKEQLVFNDKLMEIMVYELKNGIGNLKKYPLRSKLITWSFARWQYIGGDVNSFFYRIHKDRCSGCNLCIKECPRQNIYRDKKGEIRFHHKCDMCMRCSMRCPHDAFYIGFLDKWGWKVNGAYNFKKIEEMEYKPVIDINTRGFFECYYEYFEQIDTRYHQLFGGEMKHYPKKTNKYPSMLRQLLTGTIIK